MNRKPKSPITILCVDDSPDTLEMLARNLRYEGYTVLTADSVSAAAAVLEETEVRLVITDNRMPEKSGMELVRHVRDNYVKTGIIMITGYPTIENAVAAVKFGADEYLPKPFTREELLICVQTTADRYSAQPEPAEVRFHGIIGRSVKMQKVFSDIRKIARTNATTLITGESGTGKELAARAVHYESSRRANPFVSINCGAIPENLLESELFGHEKGSFTGADQTKAGFFQTADRGTIFLDEIGDTSPAMQIKLLRVLQDKKVYMVGSNTPHQVDIRIICATNKNLETMVKQGLFREDLYYRINVLSLEMPPLRERGHDVDLLCAAFAEKYAEEAGKECPSFTPRASDALFAYEWPGNVRELENVVQKVVFMNDSNIIDVKDLPHHFHYCITGNSAGMKSLKEMEREYIRLVMEKTGYNKTRAADILGINRKTLRQKLP